MSPPLSLDPLLAALPGALAGLFLVLTALALSGALLRRRRRRQAAATLSLLGSPRQTLSDADGPVTLLGTLQIVGPPCPALDSGAPSAATTAKGSLASVSQRAERLRLAVNGQLIDIAGPVEVVVGSTETHPGPLELLTSAVRKRLADASKPDAPPTGPLALRNLRDGDAVLAKGMLTRGDVPSASASYRDTPWTLSASPSITLAAAAPPRIRGLFLSSLAHVRRPSRLLATALIITSLSSVLSAALTAMYLNSRVNASPSPALTASAPRFADSKECESAARRYADAMSLIRSCSTDNECDVEMRGEMYFDLEGCFRFKNHRASTEEPDRLAKEWLGLNCVQQYEACTEVPRAMCREGKCVERPPAPIPEDWVRHDIAKQLSFFAPREWRSNQQMGLPCGPGAMLFIGTEDVAMRFLYDRYDEVVERKGPFEEHNLELFHHKARLVQRRLEPGDYRALPKAMYEIHVRFLDLLTCPPFCRIYNVPNQAHFLISAYCKEKADCDTALEVIKTLRTW